MSAAGQPSPWDGGSGRLWSVWEMMSVHAPTLLELAKEIGRINAGFDPQYSNIDMNDQTKANNLVIIGRHKTLFEQIGLRMCVAQTNRITNRLGEDIKIGEHNHMLRELYNRLEDECGTLHFISLLPEEARFYNPALPLFGSDVEDILPGTIEDVAEAGKCLGLQRPTASVFHLMRVMEVGVQRFGDKLGVTLTDEKVWQVILDGVNAAIKRLGKVPEAKAYASISANLYAVKLAWRNEVMHPKATYTPEEANGIFAAVRVFMNDLVKVL